MGELLVWLSTHPDVKVRFNYDSIFHAFRIRVIKGRYISEHMMTEDEEVLQPADFGGPLNQ